MRKEMGKENGEVIKEKGRRREKGKGRRQTRGGRREKGKERRE